MLKKLLLVECFSDKVFINTMTISKNKASGILIFPRPNICQYNNIFCDRVMGKQTHQAFDGQSTGLCQNVLNAL